MPDALAITPSPAGLTLTSPAWPGLAVGPLVPAISLDGVRRLPVRLQAVAGEDIALTATFGDSATLTLTCRPLDGGISLESTLHYTGPQPAILNRVDLLTLADRGRASFGDGEEQARVYQAGGYHSYVRGIAEQPRRMAVDGAEAQVVDEANRPAEGSSMMVWALWQPAVGRALLLGFDTFERWGGTIETTYQPPAREGSPSPQPSPLGRGGDAGPAATGMVRFTAGFDGGDLPLEPGETLPLESMVVLTGDHPWRLLEAWGDHVQRKHGLRPPGPLVSWCSWYPYRLTVTEDLVLANAAIAAERLRPLGLSVMEVDLGWERGWLPSEYTEKAEFPHGLAGLADRLADRGLELGVWNAPFSISEFQAVAMEHPEWLLPDDQGRPAVEGTWFWEPHGNVHVLDLTHPGAQAWLRSNIESLAARGARYLKCDFISSVHNPGLRRRHDPRIVAGGGLEAGRLGARIIREAFGDGLVLNCNGWEGAGLGLFELLYTCYDTGNTGFVGWRHLRECYTTVACHLYKQGRWGTIQPSCLCVGLPGTLEEARARATATFLCGGEVNISDDLVTLPEDRWQVLQAVLPPLGRPAEPLDLFESDCPSIWHLPVETEWDRWSLAGLFNFEVPPNIYDYRNPGRREFAVPLERLGLDPAARHHAYEFWSGRYLGEVSGTLESAFFGPAVQLIALRPARPHPWVVGTGFHASCGAELTDVAWDEGRRTLRGTLHRPPGHQGTLTFAAPGRPTAVVAGRPAPVRPGANGSWVLPITTEADQTEWEVTCRDA